MSRQDNACGSQARGKSSPLELFWLAGCAATQQLLDYEETAGILSAPERAMTDPFRRAVRVAVRLLLSRHSDAVGTSHHPARLPIEPSPGGQPTPTMTDLRFSVSHTQQRALILISQIGEVGVDLEARQELKMAPERRDDILVKATTAGLSAPRKPSTSEERPKSSVLTKSQEFMQLWPRLEALAKARGDGIGAVLAAIGTRGAPNSIPASALMQGFKLHDIKLEPPLNAAMALPETVIPPMLHDCMSILQPLLSQHP